MPAPVDPAVPADAGASASAAARLQDRYGAPRMQRSTARTLIVIAAVLGLALLAYVGVRATYKPVSVETIRYEHLDETRIAITFQITMPPGTEASCTLEALNEGRAQVGFTEVIVPAQEERQSAHRVELATQGDAVSGLVTGCAPR